MIRLMVRLNFNKSTNLIKSLIFRIRNIAEEDKKIEEKAKNN